MNYSYPTFFFFCAFALVGYYFLPWNWRKSGLIVTSLLWMASWKPAWTILYFSILTSNYLFLKVIRSRSKPDGGFAALLVLNICLFVFLRVDSVSLAISHPFGLSFFFLMLIGLILDEWRKPDEAYGLQDYLLLPLFFPLLMAGPLERGKSFFSQFSKGSAPWYENVSDGVILASLGIFRKLAVLPVVMEIRNHLLHAHGSLVGYLLLGLIETFSAYVDLSAYALIGRGASKAFGLSVPVHFRPILFSSSPGDFWARWNITLGTWIRDYLSFPLLLKFGRKLNQNLLLLIAFLCVGLWHGFEWTWVLFGLFNGTLVVAANILGRKFPFRFQGRVLALLLIIGNGLILKNSFLQPMKNFLPDPHILKEFASSNWVFLLCLLFLDALEEYRKDSDWMLKQRVLPRILIAVFLIILFLFSLDLEFIPRIDDLMNLPVYFKL